MGGFANQALDMRSQIAAKLRRDGDPLGDNLMTARVIVWEQSAMRVLVDMVADKENAESIERLMFAGPEHIRIVWDLLPPSFHFFRTTRIGFGQRELLQEIEIANRWPHLSAYKKMLFVDRGPVGGKSPTVVTVPVWLDSRQGEDLVSRFMVERGMTRNQAIDFIAHSDLQGAKSVLHCQPVPLTTDHPLPEGFSKPLQFAMVLSLFLEQPTVERRTCGREWHECLTRHNVFAQLNEGGDQVSIPGPLLLKTPKFMIPDYLRSQPPSGPRRPRRVPVRRG